MRQSEADSRSWHGRILAAGIAALAACQTTASGQENCPGLGDAAKIACLKTIIEQEKARGAQPLQDTAKANWGFVTWGMSAGDVGREAQARGYSLQPVHEFNGCGNDSMCLFELPNVELLDIHLRHTRFGFGPTSRLTKVRLTTIRDPSYFYRLEKAMLGEFGQPIDRQSDLSKARTWRDLAKGNLITLMGVGDESVVEYQPIGSRF